MAFDYSALSTWKTRDLLSRDSRLVNRTRVMGMSEKAAIIHVVTLVCTAGFSLPINLGFCIWHAHRYDEIKKERMFIRQILGNRNMSYRGKGHWVEVQPDPNKAQRGRVQPTPNKAQPGRVQPPPNRAQPGRVQPPPNRGRTDNDRQLQNAQPNANASVNNDPQMQYEQAYVNASVNNDPQMQYEQPNADVSVNNDPQMQYEQPNADVSVNYSQEDYGYYAENDQMQSVENNGANASVNDCDQDVGGNAEDDLQFQQDFGDSAMIDLEQDVGISDGLSEAIGSGLLDLLSS